MVGPLERKLLSCYYLRADSCLPWTAVARRRRHCAVVRAGARRWHTSVVQAPGALVWHPCKQGGSHLSQGLQVQYW